MNNLILSDDSPQFQLDERLEVATGRETRAELYRLLNEARPLLGRDLFFALEAAINADRCATTEAAFHLGWQAHADPSRWIFGAADAAG